MTKELIAMNYFITNIAQSIFNQIGLDRDKYSAVKNVVRENLYDCFLFREDLIIKSIKDFEEDIKMFIDKCLNDVLETLV